MGNNSQIGSDGPSEDGMAEEGKVEDGKVEDGKVEDEKVERGTAESGEPVPDCERLAELPAESAIRNVLSLFGKKHTLAIMYEFAFSDGPLRYSDLEQDLEISSTTLSNRLEALTEAGYVEREAFNEIPPRVEYTATEKTHALTPIFEDLYQWAAVYGEATDSAETAAGH